MSAADRPNISRVEVYWHTVKYRTVVLYVVVIVAIAVSLVYLVFPEVSSRVMRAIANAGTPPAGVATQSFGKQARFVNLDGKVQVKKANSVQWVTADYQVTLDKGDLIQTGPEGVARIVFADGTTYTVKGDTLVTVEENIVSRNSATQVGMHITSGQVDLLTGSWNVPGSKAQVSFENAVASVNANSRAAVVSDPQHNEQQITIDSGSAVLNRGDQHVDIGQFERATFPAKGSGEIVTTQVLAPPELLQPLDLAPIIVPDPKHASVHFEWKPAATAKTYEFQLGTTNMFNHLLIDQKTDATSADAVGLEPGNYFWRVRAIDDKGNVSDPSDPYKFILAAQGKEQQMLLDVAPPELEGNVVEVTGRTEPGAALIINGEQVADIQSDGTFRFFTQPMTRGSHTIVITGQNRRGGTNIKRVEVVIP